MRNKFAVLLILKLGLGFNLQAQVGKYAIGDSIFVWASSLNMREGPSPKAKIVGKANYGSVVVIVDDTIGKVAYRYKALEKTSLQGGEKSKDFYLNGYWVKVNFDGTAGYVFDGYLSKIKTKSSGSDKFGLLESWAKKDLKLRPKKFVDKERGCAWTEYVGKPDLIRVRFGHTEKTAFREVKLKNISFEEGCMLGFHLFEGSYLMDSGTDKVVFKSLDENGDCEIWVTRKGSWIVIHLTCSC